MKTPRLPTRLLALLLAPGVVACGGDAAPRILEFAANPVTVAAGATTTLRWRVDGAQTVRIDGPPGRALLGTTDRSSGELVTPALTSSTTFTLVAVNGGATAQRELFVALRRDPLASANIVAFTATPMTVVAGGAVTLSWTTERATSGELRVGREVLTPISANALGSGSYRIERVLAATAYTLAIEGPDGRELLAEVRVELQAGGPPIRTFSVTPETIVRGDSTTLTWAVEGAASLAITGNLTGTLYSGSQASGTLALTPRFSELYTLVATDDEGRSSVARAELTVAPPRGATILAFTATPPNGNPGALVRLGWRVDNAPGGVVLSAGATEVTRSTDEEGFVEVSVATTTTYTLRAINAQLGDDNRSLTVVITDPPGARIRDFSADQSTIDLGARVRLSWRVENAPGGLDVLDASGAVLLTVTSTASTLRGHLDVYPDGSTTYRLLAYNRALGDAQWTLPITVRPARPSITTLEATPSPAPRGGTTDLSWRVLGADSVRLFQDGVELAGAPVASRGSRTLQVGLESSHVELRAVNAIGTSTRGFDLATLGLPVIENFNIQPHYYTGAPPATVAFIWTTFDTTDIELWIDGVQVRAGNRMPIHQTTPGPLAGQLPITFTGGINFDLVARNAAGTVLAHRALSRLVAEPPDAHDNPVPPVALPLLGDGSGYMSSIDVSNDVDWYSLDVPPGGSMYVETADGALNACLLDLILQVYDSNFTLLLADDDSGALVSATNGCAVLDGRRRPELQDLPGGTYYLRVNSFPVGQFLVWDTGAYSIVAWSRPAACGDGIIQSNSTPPEQCDDGNMVPGDGCSPACAVEPLRQLSGPGTEWLVPGTVNRVRSRNYYQLDLTAPALLRAALYTPTVGNCFGIDPLLILYDGALHELGRDDDDGLMACPSIDAARDPWASLSPGTYLLSVSDVGDDELVESYLLSVELLSLGCGNGIIEAGEACDDGNLVSGDGCSASCTFEGVIEREALGNDTLTGPGVSAPTTGGELLGAIGALRDQDWWAVQVPAGYQLDAWLSVGSSSSCPATGPRVRLGLFDASGRQLGFDDHRGPSPTCGRIAPETTAAALSMAAGIYYLRVDVTGAAATVPAYTLHVGVAPPACGNGALEPPEACDDGNLAAGDGCSPGCAFEVFGAPLTVPGATVPVSLGAAGASVVLQIDTAVPGQAIEVTTRDASGNTCDLVDTALELYDANFRLLGRVGDGGLVGRAGTCAALRYPLDAFAANLPVGTYYLAVVDESGSGDLSAVVRVHDALCGNAFVEDLAGEACDDGNTRPLDRCDGLCRFEPLQTIALPTAAPVTLTASIALGARDPYALEVGPNPVYLYAESWAPSAAVGCPTADTVLRVTDAAARVTGVADDGGRGGCSRITPRLPFARLDPGRWYLSIGDFADDEAIALYTLTVDAREVGTCGNGVREGAEQCDDRNLQSGDGCSSACVAELLPPVREVEPNDAAAAAQLLGALSAADVVDLEGAIDTLGDEDWYSFTLAPPDTVTALVTSYALFDDLSSCDYDDELWLYRGVPANLSAQSPAAEPALVAYDNNGGVGLCAAVSGASGLASPIPLAPGTYYLRVRAYHHATIIPGYFVRLDLR